MRICLHIPTGKLVEMQSDATEGTLINNAVNGGYLESEVKELVVTEEEYKAEFRQ